MSLEEPLLTQALVERDDVDQRARPVMDDAMMQEEPRMHWFAMSKGRACDTRGGLKEWRGPKPRSGTTKDSAARKGHSHDQRKEEGEQDRQEDVW